MTQEKDKVPIHGHGKNALLLKINEKQFEWYQEYITGAEIRKLGILVCGIPALEDLVETLRHFGRSVEFQPFPLDNDAGGRLRILLVLRDKIVIRHRTTLDVERRWS